MAEAPQPAPPRVYSYQDRSRLKAAVESMFNNQEFVCRVRDVLFGRRTIVPGEEDVVDFSLMSDETCQRLCNFLSDYNVNWEEQPYDAQAADDLQAAEQQGAAVPAEQGKGTATPAHGDAKTKKKKKKSAERQHRADAAHAPQQPRKAATAPGVTFASGRVLAYLPLEKRFRAASILKWQSKDAQCLILFDFDSSLQWLELERAKGNGPSVTPAAGVAELQQLLAGSTKALQGVLYKLPQASSQVGSGDAALLTGGQEALAKAIMPTQCTALLELLRGADHSPPFLAKLYTVGTALDKGEFSGASEVLSAIREACTPQHGSDMLEALVMTSILEGRWMHMLEELAGEQLRLGQRYEVPEGKVQAAEEAWQAIEQGTGGAGGGKRLIKDEQTEGAPDAKRIKAEPEEDGKASQPEAKKPPSVAPVVKKEEPTEVAGRAAGAARANGSGAASHQEADDLGEVDGERVVQAQRTCRLVWAQSEVSPHWWPAETCIPDRATLSRVVAPSGTGRFIMVLYFANTEEGEAQTWDPLTPKRVESFDPAQPKHTHILHLKPTSDDPNSHNFIHLLHRGRELGMDIPKHPRELKYDRRMSDAARRLKSRASAGGKVNGRSA